MSGCAPHRPTPGFRLPPERRGRAPFPFLPLVGFVSFRVFCTGRKQPVSGVGGVDRKTTWGCAGASPWGRALCCCRCGCAWREGSWDVVVEERGSCQGWPHSPPLDSGLRWKDVEVGRLPAAALEGGPRCLALWVVASAGRTGGCPRSLVMTSSPKWVNCCSRMSLGKGVGVRVAPPIPDFSGFRLPPGGRGLSPHLGDDILAELG